MTLIQLGVAQFFHLHSLEALNKVFKEKYNTKRNPLQF